MQPMVQVEHLTKTFTMHQFKHRQISGCENINFTVNKGEFIGITGKSGAGKSTILKCIYRTYLPTEGHVHYFSEQFGWIDLASANERHMIAIRKHELSYVSQFLSIMPRVTALEFVMESMLELGESASAAKLKASEMLNQFKLPESLWDTFPKTFSGGEKLRLNLARAMVRQSKLLLLDEPTASLDQASKESVKERINELKQRGTTMVGIFHDLDFMQSVVDRTYTLETGMLREAR